MKLQKLPKGWDEKRISRVLEHYEHQNEDDAVAEDEASLQKNTQTVMEVPSELVPLIREIVAKHQKRHRVG